MANTKLPFDPARLRAAVGLTESLQSARLRAGGPSSSHLLNDLFDRIKSDLLGLGRDVADASAQVTLQAALLGGQNAGLVRMISSLSSRVASLTPNGSQSRALADFFLNPYTVFAGGATGADVNPLFGQAILPVRSRQNVLVIERAAGELPAIPAETGLLVALQPSVTATTGAVAPSDWAFGEDPEGVFALDADPRTAWMVPDPTQTPHMAWVEVRLPGNVSGAYRCNEFEFVPEPAFACSLVAVQAEVLGQGWMDVDFSYLPGYDAPTRSVIGLGPSRLCFAENSISRFRLGLWVSGTWGFSSVRALDAVYVASAPVSVSFSALTASVSLITPLGKNPGQLGQSASAITGAGAVLSLTPAAGAQETPVLTGVRADW